MHSPSNYTHTNPLLTRFNVFKKFLTSLESARTRTSFYTQCVKTRGEKTHYFLHARRNTRMRVILYTSGHSHNEITTQLTQNIKFARNKLNIEIKNNAVQAIDKLKDNKYLRINKTGDAGVELLEIANRRDNVTRNGNDITELLETNIPRSDMIIINSAGEAYDSTIEFCLTNNCSVAITNAAVTLHNVDSLGIVDNLRDVKQLNTEYSGGRPPIGTTVKDGELVRADNYRNVCNVLALVVEDEITKKEASMRLCCTRQTINNAMQRRELYNLK